MKGTGQALAHGAISILNAFPTGKGGALGMGLWTRAQINLYEGHGEISALILGEETDPGPLAVTVVKKTLSHYGYEGKLDGRLITSSNIPIAVGLKSSSAAANAIALATASALDQQPDDDVLIDIGVEASIESKVSLTGAYDDSLASYHGGAFLTDNDRRRIEKKLEISANLKILILVPPRKTFTSQLDRAQFLSVKEMSDQAYAEASNGRVWDALTTNGLAISSVLDEDPGPALSAIEAGALGAGLSGKGPSIAAIISARHLEKVRQAFEHFEGKIIETSPNFSKAMIEK